MNLRYPCTDSRIIIKYNIIFEYERLGMRSCYIISFFQTTWELGPSARSKGQSIQLLLRQMMPIRVSDCYFLSIIRINYTSSRTKPTRQRRCVIRRPEADQLYHVRAFVRIILIIVYRLTTPIHKYIQIYYANTCNIVYLRATILCMYTSTLVAVVYR